MNIRSLNQTIIERLKIDKSTWRSSILVHITVYKLRGLVNSFSRKCTIIIIVFFTASVLASIPQKTDDYFNISWIYQNYDHSIFAQTVISTWSFVYYNNTVLGIEILIPQQWIGNHKDDNTVSSGDPNLVQFFSPQKRCTTFCHSISFTEFKYVY